MARACPEGFFEAANHRISRWPGTLGTGVFVLRSRLRERMDMSTVIDQRNHRNLCYRLAPLTSKRRAGSRPLACGLPASPVRGSLGPVFDRKRLRGVPADLQKPTSEIGPICDPWTSSFSRVFVLPVCGTPHFFRAEYLRRAPCLGYAGKSGGGQRRRNSASCNCDTCKAWLAALRLYHIRPEGEDSPWSVVRGWGHHHGFRQPQTKSCCFYKPPPKISGSESGTWLANPPKRKVNAVL